MRPLPPVGDVRLELSPPPPLLPVPVVSGSPVGSSGRLMASSSSLVPDRLRLPLCFLGVFVCYFYYGILQEKITRGKYGEGAKQETFAFALTLVFIQCVINAVFAKIWWIVPGAGSMLPVLSPIWVPWSPATQHYSLSTTQLRSLVNPASQSQLLSLTLDGLTGVSQDHMRAHYQTGSNHMMLNINLWSTLLLGMGILFTGELWEFLSFAERYPAIIYNILLFGLTSALGQSFIFMTVVYFGPLTCSIITTTRKFFTILASVILFANPISPVQWVGTVLVFLGLGLDAKFGKGAKKTSH
ncbi:solute carrier family 35 member B1 isoform X2 [Rhinopithecus roxellana]|uniref:solute carrier family 35 member B1 isoform X2 n=1 Tax=Rhinopithecus roxellana TaxID=61622 RepID=UPI000533108F|nr:solute carrier family 35 member B1 isoform X2 [Rhinopithecus roxellana]XP_017709432.1 PREDICTED: solute carrier family 35 member B1 isoform X2 [Rhinopithecus bieti]